MNIDFPELQAFECSYNIDYSSMYMSEILDSFELENRWELPADLIRVAKDSAESSPATTLHSGSPPDKFLLLVDEPETSWMDDTFPDSDDILACFNRALSPTSTPTDVDDNVDATDAMGAPSPVANTTASSFESSSLTFSKNSIAVMNEENLPSSMPTDASPHAQVDFTYLGQGEPVYHRMSLPPDGEARIDESPSIQVDDREQSTGQSQDLTPLQPSGSIFETMSPAQTSTDIPNTRADSLSSPTSAAAASRSQGFTKRKRLDSDDGVIDYDGQSSSRPRKIVKTQPKTTSICASTRPRRKCHKRRPFIVYSDDEGDHTDDSSYTPKGAASVPRTNILGGFKSKRSVVAVKYEDDSDAQVKELSIRKDLPPRACNKALSKMSPQKTHTILKRAKISSATEKEGIKTRSHSSKLGTSKLVTSIVTSSRKRVLVTKSGRLARRASHIKPVAVPDPFNGHREALIEFGLKNPDLLKHDACNYTSVFEKLGIKRTNQGGICPFCNDRFNDKNGVVRHIGTTHLKPSTVDKEIKLAERLEDIMANDPELHTALKRTWPCPLVDDNVVCRESYRCDALFRHWRGQHKVVTISRTGLAKEIDTVPEMSV